MGLDLQPKQSVKPIVQYQHHITAMVVFAQIRELERVHILLLMLVEQIAQHVLTA
jgi:hypothetical protein